MLLDCLIWLVDAGQVHVVVVPREDANPPKRYNQFVVEDAYAGQLYEHLACPATHIGVRVSDLALPALAAVFGDQAASASTVASHARVMPQKNGRGVMQGGKLTTWIQCGCFPRKRR